MAQAQTARNLDGKVVRLAVYSVYTWVIEVEAMFMHDVSLSVFEIKLDPTQPSSMHWAKSMTKSK